MKILYISNSRLPTEKAHGYQILNTCAALAEQGVNITLLIPKRFNDIKQNIFSYYNITENFAIKKVFCLDFLKLPFLKKFSFLIESFTFALSAKKYIKDNSQGFDVIYTRDFIIAKFLKNSGKPIYYEIHTIPKTITKAHKKVWRSCAGIVAISEGLRNELKKQGINENKILVARDAVDIKKFDINFSKSKAREKLHLSQDKKIIVYAGHLYAWKGADILAQASELLSNDIQVYLIGGMDGDIKIFKNKYKNKNLHIMGDRSQLEIPLWLRAADLLVLPNSAQERISSHYTSPMKLFEYMASGTPIIASRLPSIREIVNESEVDFFMPDDVIDLVKTIKASILSKNTQEKTQKAYEKSKQYSWHNRVEKIINFIL